MSEIVDVPILLLHVSMQRMIARAWGACRNCLWGLPPKALRKT
jgi:hypothetical protein